MPQLTKPPEFAILRYFTTEPFHLRIFHTLIVFIAFAATLVAQAPSTSNFVPFGQGWQVSLSANPTIEREDRFSILVTAADTVARPEWLTPASPDSLFSGDNLLGVYYTERTLSAERRALAQTIWYARFTAKAHRRFENGVELSLGINYQAYRRQPIIDDPSELPMSSFYRTLSTRFRSIGFAGAITYHFLRQKRFQPYVGIEMWNNIEFSKAENLRLISPFNGVEIERSIPTQFLTNTITHLDTHFIAGASYQLGKNLAIGFELDPVRFRAFDAALQIRYRFPPRPRG